MVNVRAYQAGARGDGAFLDPRQIDAYSIARGQAATFTHASLAVCDSVAQDGTTRSLVVQTTAGDASHGIITQAGTTTSCVVQRSGVTPPIFTDLTIGATYYTAAAGGISTTGSNVVGVGWTDKTLRLTLPDVTAVLTDVEDIDDLTDVTISTAATGQRLEHNGTVWVNAYPDDLRDADGDTKVEVEPSADADVIVATVAGTEKARITATGLGVGTSSPDRLLHAEVADAGTTSTTYGVRVSHATSGTAAAGLGVGYEFEAEADDGNMDVIASISSELTDATGGAAESKLVLRTLDEGDDGLASRVEVDKDGILTALGGYKSADGSAGLSGTLTVDDGANWRFVLTFKNGLLTAQSTTTSTTATAAWA